MIRLSILQIYKDKNINNLNNIMKVNLIKIKD